MAKKKKPSKPAGADAPMIFGKFVSDIPVVTNETPPQYLLCRNDKQQMVRCPTAATLAMMKPSPGLCLLGLRDGELVQFYPAGKKPKSKNQ